MRLDKPRTVSQLKTILIRGSPGRVKAALIMLIRKTATKRRDGRREL